MTTDIDLRTGLGALATAPGVTVPVTWHEPTGTLRGVAVLAPGVAVPARVLAPLADALAAHGWAAVRFDFPSIGESDLDPRHVPGGMAEWGSRDLDAVLRLAADRAGPDLPLVLVGHSAGAWLVALTPMARRLDAVVAIASMSGYWRNLKRSSWGRMMPAYFVMIPVLTRLLGYLPGRVALKENAPGRALRQWAAWCRRPEFLFADRSLSTHLHQLDAPVRVLLPADDEWATVTASRAIWDRAAGRVTYEVLEPDEFGVDRIGHVGLLRERFAESVWADIISGLPAARRSPG